jgi:uncharacterized membrane protein YfcA
MDMKEKTIISTATLLTSLLTYWYARETQKDAVPYVMFGGFIGSIIGEVIVEQMNTDKKKT